jgi:hypothetical protein
MGRASSSSSSDSSSSSSRERKKRKRDKEKKHKRKRKSESKKRRKREDDPERERLKEARRLLKRRTRAADEALVPSAAAEKKRKPNDAAGGLGGLPGAAGETPLTAAQEAAARVAAARAAALQEDAALERLGAPREDVLGFRNASIAGLAGLDADAAAPGRVGASSFDARRARQKKAAERLEALLPAPATGREALFEKRAAARASNREMANAKEEGMFASGFGGELGGGGADEFRAALAANRMKREARNRRRGVDGASAALRLREHRRLEAEKMGAFQDMVGGLGEGERIEIPRRE